MPYKLVIKNKDQERTLKREEAPMLENLLDALKIQRLETEMFGGKTSPTDAQIERRLKLLAEFAARFWGHGLTVKEIMTGVSSIDGFNAIENAVAATLGMSVDDDEDDEKDKDKKPKK